MERKCGIYKITFKDKCYIGQSWHIKKRWGDHKRDLVENKHHSRYLQRVVNKYGVENLEFSILKTVDDSRITKEQLKKVLCVLEQAFINIYEPCFNFSQAAESTLGTKTSEEVKEKQARAKAMYWEFYHPDFGNIKIYNLAKYCRENQLHSGNLSKVFYGEYRSYKNYFQDYNSYLKTIEKRSKNPKSIFKGVYWDAKLKKWRANIKVDKKNKSLGFYVDERKAYEAVLVGKQIFVGCE